MYCDSEGRHIHFYGKSRGGYDVAYEDVSMVFSNHVFKPLVKIGKTTTSDAIVPIKVGYHVFTMYNSTISVYKITELNDIYDMYCELLCTYTLSPMMCIDKDIEKIIAGLKVSKEHRPAVRSLLFKQFENELYTNLGYSFALSKSNILVKLDECTRQDFDNKSRSVIDKYNKIFKIDIYQYIAINDTTDSIDLSDKNAIDKMYAMLKSIGYVNIKQN